MATASDLEAALQSANRGFKKWRAMPAYERAKVLRRAADLIRDRKTHIARILTLEEGKPLAESESEITYAAELFDWAADEGRRAYGRVVPARRSNLRQLVVREPIGPVAAFAPWNFPAVTPARKISGALGAGCSLILKPAEDTPVTSIELARACVDAGLPDGVLNVVFGTPAQISDHLIASPVIRKISFTGSTAVGRLLGAKAGHFLKKATLELGGHGPVIVFDDADVDHAVAESLKWKFHNGGQVCVAPTRFIVQDRVHDRFVDALAEGASRIVIGDGMLPNTEMGPLITQRRLEAVDELVEDAQTLGSRLLTGGGRYGDLGSFYKPTVIAGVPIGARIMNEEPFGPVAPVIRFSDADEAIAEANRLPYGLAGYVFTHSTDRALRASDLLEVGMVGVNDYDLSAPETPWGGVKESGYGVEGGSEGLDSYLVTKHIALS